MEVLRQIYDQGKLIFDKMSMPQKISFLSVLVSMVVCLFLVFFWSSRPDYVVLFANLSTKDAAAIQEKLTDMDIENKVVGNTIKVQAKEVHETRLALANEGLPRASGVGFELFDKMKIGQTDYMQRLNYQRALEGELSRTINSLKQIEFSRVHLVLPEDTIFTEAQKPASASIVLTLHPGASMDKSSVMAITNLVAASVEGLETKNITILDSNGNLLSNPTDNDLGIGFSSRQIDIQRNVEKYLEQKASTFLDGILGPRKSIVRVSTTLDFTQTEKTEETFDPEQQVARSENHIEEASEQEECGNSSVEKSITNYEIGRTVEHLIGATGQIKRISVAVVVDGMYRVVQEGEKKGERLYVARTQEELDTLKKLIVNALGLDLTQGHQIEVTNIAFDNSYFDAQRLEEEKMKKMGMVNNVVSQWPWLIIIVMFFVLLNIFKNVMKTASETKMAMPKFMMSNGKGVMAGLMSEEEVEAEREKMLGKGLELPQISKLETEVAQLAMQNPDTIARIVKTWIKEGAGVAE